MKSGLIADPNIEYPDDDGEPMSDNMLQYEWIVTVKAGLEFSFRADPNVLVAGNLLWYPVEGHPKIRLAPDVMVAIGRPKGIPRGSYKQWLEDDIAPQLVFEILSPGNRDLEMESKREFYERHGVEEYYIYDPDTDELTGYVRDDDAFATIAEMDGWVSPLTGIRFDQSEDILRIFDSEGRPFERFLEVQEDRERARQQAAEANREALRSKREANQALRREAKAHREAEEAAEREAKARCEADELRRKLRSLGIDPDA